VQSRAFRPQQGNFEMTSKSERKGAKMADLDLRKLSAPVEAMRENVRSAYKLLDAQWKAIASQLADLPIPCDVSHTYSECDYDPSQYSTLEWRKLKGGRRICQVHHHLDINRNNGEPEIHEEVTPFEEWSAETKLALLEQVPGLFEAAAKATAAFVNKVHGKGGSK
jgi:hypothetical protein